MMRTVVPGELEALTMSARKRQRDSSYVEHLLGRINRRSRDLSAETNRTNDPLRQRSTTIDWPIGGNSPTKKHQAIVMTSDGTRKLKTADDALAFWGLAVLQLTASSGQN